MSGHKAKYTRSADGTRHFVKCSCRQLSCVTGFDHAWEAQDLYRQHMELVERIRTHMGPAPSLEKTWEHYETMAKDPSVSAKDRRQWEILARELGTRLGKYADVEARPLF